MTDDEWVADQQRRHNLNTYRWPAPKPRRRPYKFEAWQIAIAIRSAQKTDTK